MFAYMRVCAALAAVLTLGCKRPPVPAERAPEPVAVPIVIAAPALATSSPSVRVLVAGDLIPHRPSLAAPTALETALAPLGPLFASADVAVANYEAATGELEKKAFRMAYAAPEAWLGAAPRAGIHAVTVANNHACDLDYEGVEATLVGAQRAGLVALGGDLKGDPWAPRLLAERDGKRICAVAWTTFVNAVGGCARTARLAVAGEGVAGRQKIASALARAKGACDATIAIVHGGDEYALQTSSMHVVADQAAEAGADAVVMHHPHVASPVTVRATRDGRHVPIFASVGNLVSNQGESWNATMPAALPQNRRLVCVNGWTRLGMIADLTFSFDPSPHLLWGYHLTWTENEHAEDRTVAVPRIATRLVDPRADRAILARLSEDERGPTAVFDDPCWAERPIFTEADRSESPRCSTTLERTAKPKAAQRPKKKR
jgi:hypothetical protein